MITAIVLASLAGSCQAEFNPPPRQAVFVFDAPGFFAFEAVGPAAQNGQVSYQLAVARTADHQPADSQTQYLTLAGVIPMGDRFMDQSRSIDLPSDAFSRLAQLREGETLELQARVRARLQGQSYQDEARVNVRLLGCEAVTTPAGQFETQRYGVSYPSLGLDPRGRYRVEQVERVVYYAPELGWPVRHDFGPDGTANLVRID
jgi:hypothetical protein